MIKLYIKRIRDGLMTIDEVPPRWREEVRKMMEVEKNVQTQN